MYRKDLFKNKTILVTGGRSGIGYAIAKQFLELGGRVFICSRKAELLEKARQELSKIGECLGFACDIRQPEELKGLADYVENNGGVLDILINNAGGQFPAPAELISSKGWAAVINNNLNGTFYVSQQMFLSFFKKQNSGIIVNITANVFRGFPGMAHTGAARAGVENMTKTLALEWAEHKVRINAVAPGTIESSGLDTYPQAIQDSFAKGREENLMKRFGTVDDVSNTVMFFSSPLSDYISGTTLYVDGLEHLAGDRMGLFNVMKSML